MNRKKNEELVLDFILKELLHVDSENVYGFSFIDISLEGDKILGVARVKYFGEEYIPQNDFYLLAQNGVYILDKDTNLIKKQELTKEVEQSYKKLVKCFNSQKKETEETKTLTNC